MQILYMYIYIKFINLIFKQAKTKFMEIAEILLNEAIKMNKNGIHFPVWGVCLGFEVIILTFT